MREIEAAKITSEIKRLCIEACTEPEPDLSAALENALKKEESEAGKEVLKEIIENNKIASREKMPLCQDTGFAVVFVKLGQEVHITGGNLADAVNQGVREGYTEGYLRKSIVSHPLKRENTKDNTPAVIHVEVVPGDKLQLLVAPKGGGSENMSTVKMMTPADGYEGVKKFVVDWVRKAGANPCPPIIVGVGIGGTFEYTALLAKKALLRKIGIHNEDQQNAKMEEELLAQINKLGIGPQGYGGRVTALAVNVETYPCHIASLPVAVNIQCHSARHKEVTI
ncbi:MAG: fumarate hydratase [Planctomycetota bacterium]